MGALTETANSKFVEVQSFSIDFNNIAKEVTAQFAPVAETKADIQNFAKPVQAIDFGMNNR